MRSDNIAPLKGTGEAKRDLDKIRGGLFGGAVGDAIGYAIEFLNEEQISDIYGSNGITEYKLDKISGKALISDDTQMSLFTACGILVGDIRGCMRGIQGDPHSYVNLAYSDWLKTQMFSYDEVNEQENFAEQERLSWLLDVPELYDRRAPGNSCISALKSPRKRNIENPINNSKGCGGIMRVAPLALMYGGREFHKDDISVLDREGAEIAAITHGHSLGYMPAAVLTHILCRIIDSYPQMSLKEIVLEARDKTAQIFLGDEHIDELVAIINKAVECSENSKSDIDNIHYLGEGWVAEETLAIAIYCSLRYNDDFSKAIMVSVNHKGDSDSTGAVTGNIVGLISGYNAIEDKLKKNLELSDVILEIADDLFYACPMNGYGGHYDAAWESKYMHKHRYNPNA